MDVYERRGRGPRQVRRQSCHARRHARRGDHLRPSRPRCPPDAVRRRGVDGCGGPDRRRRPVPACRSAGRNEGIRRAQRRVHHQCGADRKGGPIAGAVYAPASRAACGSAEIEAFVCDAPVGAGLPDPSLRRRIRARSAPDALTVAREPLALRSSDTEAFLAALPIAERRSRGSSLKFCMIGEGLADVYPRFGPTMEWDTAAGDAVLRAAGGVVLDLSGAPLRLRKNRRGLRNGPFCRLGRRCGGSPVWSC